MTPGPGTPGPPGPGTPGPPGPGPSAPGAATWGPGASLPVHRGSQMVVVHTADSREAPRLQPLDFGFHEAAHATAFGKILLANLDPAQRDLHLDPDPMPRLGPGSRRNLVRLLRAAYPHSRFPDGPYERTADAILAQVDASLWHRLVLT